MTFVRQIWSLGWGLARTDLGHGPLAAFILTSLVWTAVLILALPVVIAVPTSTLLVVLAAFCAAASVAGLALVRDYPHPHLGWCNVVTLSRLALTMMLLAPLLSGSSASWPIFWLTAVTLSLDGLDGWLARRYAQVSSFGARFDMEVDSVLALILALNAAAFSGAGAWAILLGLPRYIFGLAAWRTAWMRAPLPDRFSRKAACVVQLAALVALQAPILPDPLAFALVPLVLATLGWSFAVDLRYLWHRRA